MTNMPSIQSVPPLTWLDAVGQLAMTQRRGATGNCQVYLLLALPARGKPHHAIYVGTTRKPIRQRLNDKDHVQRWRNRPTFHLEDFTEHLVKMHCCDAYRVEQLLAQQLKKILPAGVAIGGSNQAPLKCRHCKTPVFL